MKLKKRIAKQFQNWLDILWTNKQTIDKKTNEYRQVLVYVDRASKKFCKIVVLKNFTQFEAPVQVLSFKFWNIFENSFLIEYLWMPVPVNGQCF